MKLVKLSIFALSMGLFLASCGGNTEEATPAADTAAVAPAMEEAAPAVEATTDSTAAATPAVDTTAAAPAPAAH